MECESSESLRPKFDWYQTDQFIVLSILIKEINEKSMQIEFEPKKFTFNYNHQSSNDCSKFYRLVLNLNEEILPSQCVWSLTSIKLEIKMKKKEEIRWSSLEAANSIQQNKSTPSLRSWDQLARDLEKDDDEQSDVEALFRKIYANGDENLRRAMNKSFVESNGTVLSTNWNDVGKSTVEMKPPDNCEFKKWQN
ncbi:hypothetical protein SSS_06963 [Sarcoptes scabiei]|uniref:Protein SGT1 -like protein n=1 Tax=Sarcoptes scabiei TaxID=52283 RepID=A0A131ZUK5_SARSC|nr:hypothetical protein SSS_06963 [Sarcoptes scabiei]KPM02261.1 suppressor of G2 allele of SKP1-like protein 1 [Sarcoptes scabiei]